jgi:aminodeoxychorismate lyase
MIVFFQGQFVPEEQAMVSIFDRAVMYGDGLFETLRIFKRRPLQWSAHIERLRCGADYLGIRMPYSEAALVEYTSQLLQMNEVRDGLLRIQLSRGKGRPGYSPCDAQQPWLALSVHPAPLADPVTPDRWRLVTSSLRSLHGVPLANHKTSNKLLQVLARAEADAKDGDEALILGDRGCVLQGACSNVFWITKGAVHTPPLEQPILPGTTRALVLELCAQLDIPVRESVGSCTVLQEADGVFLTLSSRGIVEVSCLDGRRLRRAPVTQRVYMAYQRWAEIEATRPWKVD